MKSSVVRFFSLLASLLAFTGAAQAQGLDPNYRVPAAFSSVFQTQVVTLFEFDGSDAAEMRAVNEFFSGRTTANQFFSELFRLSFVSDAVAVTPAQLSEITNAFLRLDSAGTLNVVNSVYTAAGYTRVNQTTWRRGGLEVEFDTSIFAPLREIFSALSALGTLDNAGPTSATVNLTNDLFATSIFEKSQPALLGKKAARAQGAAVSTVIGADAFYNRTKFDGGGSVKTYGTNLSLTAGDQFQIRGTVPLYRTDFGAGNSTTYGLDLNGKYRVSDTFAVGVHGNYIKNDSDGGDAKSWTSGAYAAAVARTGEASALSFGLLFDRVKPDGGDAAWLGGFGTNWGVSVGRNTALNPYVIYYRQFDTPAGADRDWVDVGTELQVNLSETWGFKIGLKTSLGQDGVKSNHQAYLGSAWRF